MTSPDADPAVDHPSTPEKNRKPSEIFLDAAGSTVGFGAGFAVAAAVILFIGTAIATGGINDILDQDQYGDRVEAIGAVYRQGVRAREELNRSGTVLTSEAMCEDAYHRVGADEERGEVAKVRKTKDGEPDLAFAELRRLSFINGCLGRPNHLPATPLPPAPSPTSTPGR